MSIDSNKRNKYLRTRLIQSAASGDMDMLINLSKQMQEKIDYSSLCHYAVRHSRLEMANYLIEKGATIDNYQFNRTNRIPTKSLIDLIGKIKDSDPIYKYKDYLTDMLCDACFRKRYSEYCITALNFYKNAEKRMERIERYKKDLTDTEKNRKFLESLKLILREDSLETLLNDII